MLRHFPELLALYVPIDPSWGKLTPQGVVSKYPFSVLDDLIRAGWMECARILLSVGVSRVRHRRMANARDFARYWIGTRLADRSGLESYMERFCGLPADRIDLQFAEKRMLWLREYGSVRSLLRMAWRAAKEGHMERAVNRQLARPPQGFRYLYAPVVRRLTERGGTFLLGANIHTVRKTGNLFALSVGNEDHTSARVVSTVPIDRMLKACGMSDDHRLPAVTLLSLFFSFSGERGFRESILYNFAHDGAWKRLTVYSDFYGLSRGREFLAVEVIVHENQGAVDAVATAFREHTKMNDLLRGDLRLEGSHVLTSAYPIYTEGAGDRAERAIARLRAFGVESFGRQGGFKYQSDRPCVDD